MMKLPLNLVPCVGGLLALLWSVASQATDIATLPLKASVLAKPNVVFLLDDSGSMEWNTLVNGPSDGVLWTNFNSSTLYPSNQLRSGGASGDWRLFNLHPNIGGPYAAAPNGDGNSGWGYGIPPINQTAWARSSDYNVLYYNPLKTYTPWAPAFANGVLNTFPEATPTSARWHPLTDTTGIAPNLDLTSSVSTWRFTFMSGMVIPTGATNVVCYYASFPGSLPFTVTSSFGSCTAAVPHFPATYWVKESCSDNGSSCVTNYDGQTLKRYEIKPGNTYKSGKAYTAELQNFANWFVYYRQRRLMMSAAMGEVLDSTSGLRLGVVRMNAQATPTIFDADAAAPANNRRAVAGIIYQAQANAGTPTNGTMAYIYNQFDTNTNIIQYACQRNAMFIITDGFANDSFVSPPAYNQATYGSGTPYQSIVTGSLSDKALGYFTRRLRASTSPLPAGKVPLGDQGITNPDPNPDLHLRTYALTLGGRGLLWPNAPNPFVTAPTWPALAPNSIAMLDDLWHATINGRGQMYLATDASSTAAAVRAGLDDVASQPGAQGGMAVSSVNLYKGDNRGYLGTYNPAGWVGDLTANTLDPNTGAVSNTALWSSAALLNARDWTTRVLASHNGSSGVAFSDAAVGSLVNPGSAWGATAQVMNYLRGDRSLDGSSFRQRNSLIGAVINAEAAVSREDGVAYLASGEGMLHAIDTLSNPGAELWGFIPRAVLPNLGQTTARSYAFRTQLDGTPVIGKSSNSSKALVAGMGSAGRFYYALDVSAPRGLTAAQLASKALWEFPGASDTATQAKVGQTLGKPVFVRLPDASHVVLVSSGYNNTLDGKGRVWMLNPLTGAVLHEFTTADGTLANESGLTHLSPFVQGDGAVRYVYGGDLLGNLWRMDLVAKGAPTKVAVFKDALGNLQPVTTAPELMDKDDQRIILVGTGRLLDITDFGSSRVQSFYAVSDGSTLANARSSLVQQVYTRATDSITTNSVNWLTQRGWFMDLPAGEHANTRPAIAQGTIAFSTNSAGTSDCSAASFLYVLNVLSGTKVAGLNFVGTQLSASANSSGARALLVRGGSPQVVAAGQTADGQSWSRGIVPSTTITPSKNAWREIRR